MAKNVEALKGSWDFVSGDSMDEFLKEFGMGSVIRMLAKNSKPRVIISESNGVWTIRTESALKTISLDFQPGVEYDDTAPDGRKVKGIINFVDGQWIQTTTDDRGKATKTTRWIDDNDQHHIILECGKAKVHRIHKRVPNK